MKKTKATAHARYHINYHIVFCPKYRYPVLDGEPGEYFKRLLINICEHYEYDLEDFEIMPDHVHLFISVPPSIAPAKIIQTIKSISARFIFKKFPKMKEERMGGSDALWSRGYYIGTIGQATAETVLSYIKNQKNHM
jgi:putative transposase